MVAPVLSGLLLTMEDSSSSSRRNRGLRRSPFSMNKGRRRPETKQSDTNILRGAEIIRQQIRKQLEEEDSFRKNARDVRDNLLLEGQQQQHHSYSGNNTNTTHNSSGNSGKTSSSSDDEFSDPWIENLTNGCRKMSDDSSTIFRELPSNLSSSSTGDDGVDGVGWSDLSTILEYTPSTVGRVPQPPPPPPPPEEDYSECCYTPSPVSNVSSRKKGKPSLRVLKVVKEGGRDDDTYGFVGEDYDTDLDQDDHFNSSNMNTYLPFSLRKTDLETKKSWSPTAVSTVSASPPKAKIAPRRLISSPHNNSSSLYSPDPSTTASIKPLSKASSKEQEKSPSKRQSKLFRPRNQQCSSKQPTKSNKSEEQQQQPTIAPALISPTASEKTDRLGSARSSSSSIKVADIVPSPLSVEYDMLLHDPAFCHAQQAGLVWQSLVGQQVRFPSRWWNGARAPPMGMIDDDDYDDDGEQEHVVDSTILDAKWEYLGCSNITNSRHLNRLCRSRAAPGRLLLHMIVLDRQGGQPVADFVVGVFHPNARGIRRSKDANPELEKVRTLWMALRKRTSTCTLLDTYSMDVPRTKTPIEKRRITNQNMRAVYGDEPPLETLFVPQRELEQRLIQQPLPAMALLQEFVLD